MSGTSAVDAVLTTADFVECYRVHYPRVIRALRLGGADGASAEDITQEAFARALVHWLRVRRGTNPPGYIYRTAFRLYTRRAKVGDDRPSDATVTADIQNEAATRLTVEQALAVMPPRRRLCATLCFIVGLSNAEAAEALGIAEGTLRKQLELARGDLRRAL